MNDYYKFKAFVVSDGGKEEEECDRCANLIKKYGHYCQRMDVTAAKKYYLNMLQTDKQKQFPFIFCEGMSTGNLLLSSELDGFLNMLTMSPCYEEADDDIKDLKLVPYTNTDDCDKVKSNIFFQSKSCTNNDNIHELNSDDSESIDNTDYEQLISEGLAALSQSETNADSDDSCNPETMLENDILSENGFNFNESSESEDSENSENSESSESSESSDSEYTDSDENISTDLNDENTDSNLI